MQILKLRWTLVHVLLLSIIEIQAQAVTISTPPENTTVCRDSDVTISCGYQWATALPVMWIINGTLFTQAEIMNSALYQLNNPVTAKDVSLTVLSINGTTTFRCVVQSTPITTSARGTVTVIALLPTSPMNIKFPAEYITNVSFVVQWDPVTNQSVDRYIVTWTDGTNPTQAITVKESPYNITGLTPNTAYTVNVAAVNKNNCTRPSTDINITTNASLSMDTASNTFVVISTNPTTATTVITTTTAAATTTTTTADTTDHTDTTADSTTTSSIITTTTITIILMATTTSTAISSTTTNGSNNVMPTVTSPRNVTRDSGGNGDSGGSSGGTIVGGVIGAILAIIVIVIIVIVIYYFVFYRNKDNDDGKSPYYSVIASNSSRNGKNTPAVSNSVTYDEVHKTEVKTVPHQTTDTGELYAMSTKAVNQDTQSEPPLLYTYARVDLDAKRKITETSVPHQTAADGAQYAMSTKAAAKDYRVTDNDVNENTENKEIKYADLQPLPTPPDIRNVSNEGSSQYTQLVT